SPRRTSSASRDNVRRSCARVISPRKTFNRNAFRTSRAWRCVSASGGAYEDTRDRKSTRLNSSHVAISYAVFCLKKKKKQVAEEKIITVRLLPLNSGRLNG